MKHILIILFTISLGHFSQGQCIEDSHSPFDDQGWVSCTKSISAIPERGASHWMMYDFGYNYNIRTMDIWNHNVWGETQAGVKSIMLDYSLDNINWNSVGPIDIEQAPGSWKYGGLQDINLDGINCRYMIVTVLETWDESIPCAGIAEIRFNLGEFTSSEDLVVESLNVYPNPTSQFVYIESKELSSFGELVILNTVGQEVKRIPTGNVDKITVPIQNLESGLYYISIGGKSETKQSSFVKY